MASIRKRAGKNGAAYQVEIRLRGSPAVRQSFRRMTDAKRWASETEAAIRERRYFRHAEEQKHTFGEMVDRYLEEQGRPAGHSCCGGRRNSANRFWPT